MTDACVTFTIHTYTHVKPLAGAFVASSRTPHQRPPSAVPGASSLLTKTKRGVGEDSDGGGPHSGGSHGRPFSAMPSAFVPGARFVACV